MAFKLNLFVCLLGCAAAVDYNYNSPVTNSNRNPTASDIAYENVPNSIDTGSVSSASSVTSNNYNNNNVKVNYPSAYDVNSVATPFGYDYNAQQVVPSTPSASAHGHANANEWFGPAKYDYSYAVAYEPTGDFKSHSESRNGASVRGSYSVVDPDGYKRIVTYTVDGDSGFNAIVNREPYALKISNAAGLPLTNAQQALQLQQQSSAQESRLDVPLQPRDSYAVHPTHNGEGLYP